MDAIILFSHGSLLCGAGEALEGHAARLRAQGLAPIVEVGYLNYSEPLFAEAAAKCAAAGATRIIVSCFFLIPGYFVKVDLPKCLEAARAAHPHLEWIVTDAIGFDPRLADALLQSAETGAPPSEWRSDLKRAARFCRANPQCPLFGTADCPATGEDKKARRQEEGKTGEETTFSFPASDFASDATYSPLPVSPSALLIMVHGSPRPVANQEMYRVVEVLKEKAGARFPIVEVGFMECNEPTIPEAIDRCVAQGAKTIVALPYFLHTGTHVADDLPTLLEEGRERYPDVEFRMSAFLGRSEVLTDILADRIRAVLYATR